MDATDPSVALEALKTWENRGYLVMAAEAAQRVVSPSSGATVEYCLIALAEAYLECFTKGAWETALKRAQIAFERFLQNLSPCGISLHLVRLYSDAPGEMEADLT